MENQTEFCIYNDYNLSLILFRSHLLVTYLPALPLSCTVTSKKEC